MIPTKNLSRDTVIAIAAISGILIILGVGLRLIIPARSTISGFVVSHHDLVKGQRDRLYAEVAGRINRPKTIVLLSPNHYDAGRGEIQTSTQTWQVTSGTIEPNLTAIKALIGNGVTEEPGSFISEHGIHLQLADIQQYFPGSKIVPLIFKSHISYQRTQEIEQDLKNVCSDCLMIASVDFSHYQPAILANLHDNLTERYLDQLDSENLMNKSEVNCPSCLSILSQWAKDHGTSDFHIKDHTNSGILVSDLDGETTTHFFGWYQAGKKVTPPKSVSFIFGGKTQIESTSLPPAKSSPENLFALLGERTFWGTDSAFLQFGNSAITNYSDLLSYLKIPESIFNFEQATDSITEMSGNGLNLEVISVQSEASPPDLSDSIRRLKANPTHRVVVLETGKNLFTVEEQSLIAHTWIDAGADMVIESQTNPDESGEVYKGHPIIYSLGDFLDTAKAGESTGQLLAGEFTEDKVKLFFLPVTTAKSQPVFLRGAAKQKALDSLYQPLQGFEHSTPYGSSLSFP